jgi:glutaredoxin-like YruB-family protein
MTVKIYSTDTCFFCKKAKEFLKQNKIKFQEFDVMNDEAAAREMINVSGQSGVPVLDIDGTIIVGFDQPKIKKALKL